MKLKSEQTNSCNWEELKKLIVQEMREAEKHPSVCPTCGRCSTCGRSAPNVVGVAWPTTPGRLRPITVV